MKELESSEDGDPQKAESSEEVFMNSSATAGNVSVESDGSLSGESTETSSEDVRFSNGSKMEVSSSEDGMELPPADVAQIDAKESTALNPPNKTTENPKENDSEVKNLTKRETHLRTNTLLHRLKRASSSTEKRVRRKKYVATENEEESEDAEKWEDLEDPEEGSEENENSEELNLGIKLRGIR